MLTFAKLYKKYTRNGMKAQAMCNVFLNVLKCLKTGSGVIKASLVAASVLTSYVCHAQEQLLNLQAEARVDYQREYIDGEADKANSGFKGKFVNLIASGTINDHFSYAYRQRLVKANSEQSLFDAIDWIYLTWRADEHWEVSAGKQVVGIGGYEYDRAPIDLYFCSEYWNNIPCYQLGVSAAYNINGGKDKILAQYCQSPFRANADDMYAYNIMWYGSHGWLNTIYSVNLIEYMPHKYISYLALGHRLDFGEVKIELDFMNRAGGHQAYFFKDFSVMSEVSYSPTKKLNVFGRVTYDVNKTSNTAADCCVLPGTELTYVGGGVEFYPVKNSRNVRLHAYYAHSFGKNGNENCAVPPKQDFVSVGLKWKVDLLAVKNKLIKK